MKKKLCSKADLRDLKLILPQKHVEFKIRYFMKVLNRPVSPLKRIMCNSNGFFNRWR